MFSAINLVFLFLLDSALSQCSTLTISVNVQSAILFYHNPVYVYLNNFFYFCFSPLETDDENPINRTDIVPGYTFSERFFSQFCFVQFL